MKLFHSIITPLILLAVAITTSCSNFTRVEPSTINSPTNASPMVTYTSIVSTPTPSVPPHQATMISRATEMATWHPLPTTPPKYPTPLYPEGTFFTSSDIITSYTGITQIVGDYILSIWDRGDFTRIVTISTLGEKQIEIEDVNVWIDKATGKDLNGDGFPEAIIRSYVGGTGPGAPCNTVSIISLADKPEIILDKASNCSDHFLSRENREAGKTGDFFLDIDNDGTFEFITFGFKLGNWMEPPSFMYIWKYDSNSHNYTIISTKEITVFEYEDVFLELSQNDVP